ncbi:hypothetical protein [Trichlorobacter ammonificans]|uniref:VRR-NUC domain-containing protein n=1 Tax=Trichlorobacter ammonificans TaxID=2916410 RepID=A0ABM9D8B0_9BACT|nr:hypothetical protein [Trichlorobacter ammonificans]CAH2030631.1 VRR-NUC domain-containing protein [Trichlorobacter ammonificans]
MARALTNQMQKALQEIAHGKEISITSRTLTGLVNRGLADVSGKLTNEGWKQAVVALPLEEQCQYLGITYQKLPGLEFKGNPELAAWRYFSSQGYVGGYCEGGPILLLIRAAALEVLTNINTFKSREDACTRATEAQFTIHRQSSHLILNAISTSKTSQIVRHFNEIYSSPLIEEWYPGLTCNSISQLFESLGAERLMQIATAFMEAPYTYRAGWPDLTMTNGVEMLWAEIKTIDRLHLSQITTISRMKPLLPGSVRVVQLTS